MASKLDGAGIEKLNTIEAAQSTIQTIHGHVERMAIEVKAHRGPGVIPQQIKRIAGPLQGRLKGHFGMVADLVSNMVLALGRGGSDELRCARRESTSGRSARRSRSRPTRCRRPIRPPTRPPKSRIQLAPRERRTGTVARPVHGDRRPVGHERRPRLAA